MSEYPVHCDKCGNYIGYVHATDYGKFVCEECGRKQKALEDEGDRLIKKPDMSDWDEPKVDTIFEPKSENDLRRKMPKGFCCKCKKKIIRKNKKEIISNICRKCFCNPKTKHQYQLSGIKKK